MADELETLDDDAEAVFIETAGSTNTGMRHLWRRNRNAAYRQAYKEREGKQHPTTKAGGQPKKDLDALLKKTEPPHGMSWEDFGILWDLHPEHPFTPVLRKQSVEAEWQKVLDEAEASK